MRHRYRDVRPDVAGDTAGAAARHLLVHDRLGEHIAAAAVFLGISHSQVAELSHPLEDLPRHLSCLFPFLGVRRQLVLDELPYGLAPYLVLGTKEVVAHGLLLMRVDRFINARWVRVDTWLKRTESDVCGLSFVFGVLAVVLGTLFIAAVLVEPFVGHIFERSKRLTKSLGHPRQERR